MKWETHASFPLSEKTSASRHMENLLAHSNTLLNILTRLSRITSTADVEEISQSAKNIAQYLPLVTTPEKLTGLDRSDINWENYVENYYSKILDHLIASFDDTFPVLNGKINEYILNLFVVEHNLFFSESLATLVMNLKNCNEIQVNGIVILLENLLKSNGLLDYLVKGCTEDKNSTEYDLENTIFDEMKYKNVIQILVSIPARTANQLMNKNPPFFATSNICNIFVLNLVRTILILADIRKENIQFNTKVLSELFGKILTHLYNPSRSEEFGLVIKIFEKLCSQESIEKKIVNSVICDLNSQCIETALNLCLNYTSPNDSICNILSKAYELQDWQYNLLTKIPLLSYHDHNNITFLYNFVMYIVHNKANNYKMTTDFLINMLTTWSSKSAITHTSIEQHIYITKIIIMTVRILDKRGFKFTPLVRNELTEILIKGIPSHIESPNVNIRIIGMTTAEIIMSILKECEGIELKFDYDSFSKDAKQLAKDLKNLGSDFKVENLEVESPNIDNLCYDLFMNCMYFNNQDIYAPNAPSISKTQTKLASLTLKDSEIPENTLVTQSTSKNNLITIIDSTDFELDSDDDLEPYDLSNDVKYNKKEPPSYLRDLRDNLIDGSDPEIFILSLENAEKLIRTQLPNDDVSLAIELLEIFMVLEKKYFMENFDSVVFNCAVNITVIYPEECAKYICNQFHDANCSYSIAQRMFMLDILSQSAQLLSKVKAKARIRDEGNKNNAVSLAEKTLKEKLENKTRRFFSNYEVASSENKFAKVAGSFFFPLVYGFKSFSAFALTPRYDSDNILLIHFLKTISILMYSSQNCPVVSQMAREILDISLTIRYHKESKVRLGVLHMIGAVALNVPKFILKNEFLSEMLEIRLWLINILSCGIQNSETNSECRLIATSVLCLVENSLKVEQNEMLY